MSDAVAESPGLELADVERAPAAAGSLAGRIEQEATRRSRVARIKPSRYSGNLILVCHKLTTKQIAQASQIRSPWAAAADLLVKACEDVELVDPDTGDTVAQGIGIDGRLTELFPSISGEDAREIARTTFAGDVELITVGQRLADWTAGKELEDLSPEDVLELLGEEPATT